MKFISAKVLKPPAVVPIEYCYNSRDDGVGDMVRVQCDEWPVPEIVEQLKKISHDIVEKMFGPDVANAVAPFRYIVHGIEIRDTEKTSWGEEAAFNIMIGMQGREIKTKTPFFGLYDTYQGKLPGTRENKNEDVLGEELTQEVRHLVTLFLGYMNGERAQEELRFDEPVNVTPQEVLPGMEYLEAGTDEREGNSEDHY